MKLYSILYVRTGFVNLFSKSIREDIWASSRENALYKMKKKYGDSIDIRLIRVK